MADEDSSEFPSLKTAYLTIVDVFGALVPGLVWVTLLLLLIHFLLLGDMNLDYEYSIARKIFSSSSTVLQSSVLIAYIAVSLTVGYIVKAFAMEVAGSIESFFASLSVSLRYYLGKEYKFAPNLENLKTFNKFRYIRNGLRFPYLLLHEGEEYFKNLEGIIRNHSGLSPDQIPQTRVFSYCKRLIRITSPELWEESLQLEAEVRMMGSLFLASFLAFFISIIAAITEQDHSGIYFRLIIITLFMIIIFGLAFSRRRREEVRYTYLNTILLGSKHKWKFTP
jgi:hypothetical protein